MSGWIKLHRKIMDWEWYDEPIVRATMLHCLLRANYKDQSYKGEEIKRGSFPCGRDGLAKEIGISTQQLRTALTKLEKTGEINQRTTSKGTIITLCNYSSYQEEQPAINQHSNKPATNDQQTNNKQITTIERREEGKKVRNEEEINQTFPFVGGGDISKPVKPSRMKLVNSLDLPFDSDKFSEAWDEFKEYRNALNGNKSFTKLAAKKILSRLSEVTESEAIELIDKSIENGWKGVFPDKNKSTTMKTEDEVKAALGGRAARSVIDLRD